MPLPRQMVLPRKIGKSFHEIAFAWAESGISEEHNNGGKGTLMYKSFGWSSKGERKVHEGSGAFGCLVSIGISGVVVSENMSQYV